MPQWWAACRIKGTHKGSPRLQVHTRTYEVWTTRGAKNDGIDFFPHLQFDGAPQASILGPPRRMNPVLSRDQSMCVRADQHRKGARSVFPSRPTALLCAVSGPRRPTEHLVGHATDWHSGRNGGTRRGLDEGGALRHRAGGGGPEHQSKSERYDRRLINQGRHSAAPLFRYDSLVRKRQGKLPEAAWRRFDWPTGRRRPRGEGPDVGVMRQ